MPIIDDYFNQKKKKLLMINLIVYITRLVHFHSEVPFIVGKIQCRNLIYI